MGSTGRASRRISRRGPASAGALAALAALACTAVPRRPPATDAGLARLAAAVRHDAYGRPVDLGPLLAGRAALYFFRTDCAHCAEDLAAAPRLAARLGAPAVVLLSREGAARLRAALGHEPPGGLIVVADSEGAVMGEGGALPTRYVPRYVGVVGSRVRLDVTGGRGAGLGAALAALGTGAGPAPPAGAP